MQTGSSQLAVAIDRVRVQINAVKGVKRPISEQDTKGSLIEPILNALGWDTSALSEVRREYRHDRKDLPVDYAFFSQGQPIMFVEAKALGNSIDDHKWMAQIVNYANSAGVEICVLTNGDEYRVFNTHAKVPLAEKIIARTSVISSDPQHVFDVLECLSRIGLLEQRAIHRWQREQTEGLIRSALSELLRSGEKRLVDLLAESLKGRVPAQDISSALRSASLQLEFNPSMEKENTVRTRASARKAKVQDKAIKSSAPKAAKSPIGSAVSLLDIISAGLLHAPAELVSTYKKQTVHATLQEDGSIIYEGVRYKSPSIAGGIARARITGSAPPGREYFATNGWSFWKVKDKKGKLLELKVLRDQFLASGLTDDRKSRLQILG